MSPLFGLTEASRSMAAVVSQLSAFLPLQEAVVKSNVRPLPWLVAAAVVGPARSPEVPGHPRHPDLERSPVTLRPSQQEATHFLHAGRVGSLRQHPLALPLRIQRLQ